MPPTGLRKGITQRPTLAPQTREYKDAAKSVRALVNQEDDDPNSFWAAARTLVLLCQPVLLLRLVDGSAPCMGKVYHRCSLLQTYVKAMVRQEGGRGRCRG